MSSPRSRRRRRLVVLAISSLVALLCAEAGARALFGTPWKEQLPLMEVEAHPTRGWQMVPGQAHYTYDKRVEVNALGLRGPEVGPKTAGTVRILALGDSLVYGQGVAEDETLPVYLQAELEERDANGSRWEVINAGNRAYGTGQELALLEQLGPVLQPDVVVLYWFHNDLQERDLVATSLRLAESGPIAFDVGARVEGWRGFVWHARQVVRRSALCMQLHDVLRPGEERGPAFEQSIEQGFERLEVYLDRFVALESELGFQLFFAVLPFGPALDLDTHWGAPLEQRALELARERGIPARLLDEDVRLLAHELGRAPVIPFDGHYLPAGNRALARSACTQLLDVLR